jgi:lipase chaperone LimK
VHGRYSCAESKAAVDVLTADAPWIHREGVLAHQASATDLLLITLRKSGALFSPSTR